MRKFILGVFMASIASANICDLDPLYSRDFTFSLPRAVLESFFNGKAFDNKVSYTPEERNNLEKDIHAIWERMLRDGPFGNPVALISAGAPGAGKTVLMRQMMQKREWGNRPYIDPDDVCLKNMPLTYGAELKDKLNQLAASRFNSEEAAKKAHWQVRKDMYDKWRPASNGGAQVILGNLIRKKEDFYYGMTSSSPLTRIFFTFLKDEGYTIKLLHVTASDEVCWGSIEERDREFVQTTEKDIHEKALLVPQRIRDTYLEFADEIQFYYRPGVKENATLAATWIRKDVPSLTIVNREAYDQIKKVHNAACDLLNKPQLLWENSVEAN